MKMKIEFEHYTAGDDADDTGKATSPGETSPSGAPSPWPRRIKRLLLGPLDLPPLTRKQFARLIPELFFVRQMIDIGIGAVFLYFAESESHEAEVVAALILPFCILSLLCMCIPYYRLLYLRIKNSLLNFPRFFLSIVVFVNILYMMAIPNEVHIFLVIFELTIKWIPYVILLIIPDMNSKL